VWVDVIAFLGSLAGTIFATRSSDRISRRIRHAICALSLAVLFSLNQHRLQPWAYQFCILHAWLALAYPRWKLTGWRWLTISIYFYSASSKIDYAFCTNHGPFLLDGFLHACGFAAGTTHWPAKLSFFVAAAMPAGELLAAITFCFQRMQRIGLWLSVTMHLFLLVALGPWGHNHSAGVLIWNIFFLVQNWLLFPSVDLRNRLSPSAEVPQRESTVYGARWIAGWAILAAALLMPLYEANGLWDHWPSWAVYSARPARTLVYIHEDDVDRLPQELQLYLLEATPLEPWRRFQIDRWSLEATKTPIYPQRRFQLGVALALAERYQLSTLKVVIESRPDRQTGKRTRREVVSLEEVRKEAATFRVNALPR
jgi:hypothetical protein